MRVFTDGACSGNPGPGGWAWVTDDGRKGTGNDPETTNQRMELMAVLRAVETLDGDLAIHSDSTYVVNCFNDRWYEGWLSRGWKNSQKKPVANRDLWEPLINAYLGRAEEITFTWVKGHAGNPMNELADELAVAALDEIRPNPLGGAGDAVSSDGDAAVAGPDVPWPVERAVVVTGVRELDTDLAEELQVTIGEFDVANDIVVSGLRLGAELLGAEAALDVGLPLGVVLPFADPVKVWSAADRRRFDAAVGAAEWVVTLDGDPAAPGPAITARNRWLWTAAVGAVVVGDAAMADAAEAQGLGVIVVPADG